MAAANSSPPEDDCTCSVCCDIFKDPVVLLCGHSFCQLCLQEWWRQSGLKKCPLCKEMFMMSQPPRNLALRNLSEALRREQRAKSGSKEICSLHGERLRLFCQDDQQLICLVCRDAQKHKKHNFVPVEEAAETCRTDLKLKKMHLETKLGSFNREKLTCDKMSGHIKLQALQTEKTIKEEFHKLYQFLRAEEAARVDAVRKEEALKTEAMNIRIDHFKAEISSLKDNVQTIEKEMRADDISFMLNVGSTVERAQCNLPDPETPSGALIDEAKHLGNLLFTVWKKMENIIQYTPVTLDPNTADPLLMISQNMTSSTKSDKRLPLPENPERQSSSGVLGSEGFNSGKHSWDVDVEEGGFWTVGVTTQIKDPNNKNIWGIYICTCHVWLHDCTPEDSDGEVLLKDSFPKKVRVQLDYDRGTLSFLDLDRKQLVHILKHTFTETVFPYFSENVKILPAEHSVGITQPKYSALLRSINKMWL